MGSVDEGMFSKLFATDRFSFGEKIDFEIQVHRNSLHSWLQIHGNLLSIPYQFLSVLTSSWTVIQYQNREIDIDSISTVYSDSSSFTYTCGCVFAL